MFLKVLGSTYKRQDNHNDSLMATAKEIIHPSAAPATVD